MKKEELKIFEEFCRSYTNRFLDCVCANTEEKWLHTFSKFRYWRLVDELEDKKNITVKNTDIKAYHTYEEIMVDTLKKKIEELPLEELKAIPSERGEGKLGSSGK